MQNTITATLSAVPGEQARYALNTILRALGDRLSSQTHTSASLGIKGGSASPTVTTGAVYAGIAKGTFIAKATTTDMPALVGTVVHGAFNIFAFFIDSASAVTVAMGIAGTTLAKVVFPAIPEGKAVIGYVSVNPTGTGSFVGGTTALDDAGVVPNAVFVNTVGAFDPSIAL